MCPEISLMYPDISLIACLDEERGIGRSNGELLVRIPDDMRRFKELTIGHPVIMGRKTWDTIPAKFKPLPQRTNIVVTRNPDFQAEGIVVAHSILEAVELATTAEDLDKQEIFVIGGAQIYEQAIERATNLYLTLVRGKYGADVFFPDYSDFMIETFKEEREFSGYKYSWVNLER